MTKPVKIPTISKNNNPSAFKKVFLCPSPLNPYWLPPPSPSVSRLCGRPRAAVRPNAERNHRYRHAQNPKTRRRKNPPQNFRQALGQRRTRPGALRPGISVVEGGRAGSNGFTIRGVDKDRVAINVDGLAQAESRSSEAFQELFGAYGNFNANRNTSEPENFSEVTITKGADSLKSGSGALGGAVNYQTKSASDYVSEDKPYHLGIKGGSVGKNSQKFSSITAAWRLFGLDALLVYTRRFGKETKNRSTEGDVKIENKGYVFSPTQSFNKYQTYVATGVAPLPTDPQEWVNKSTLFKLGYNFNDRNRIGWILKTPHRPFYQRAV